MYSDIKPAAATRGHDSLARALPADDLFAWVNIRGAHTVLKRREHA